MNLTWTFTAHREISIYRWSTKEITIGGHSYTPEILPDDFGGITMNNGGDSRIHQLEDLTIKIKSQEAFSSGFFDGSLVIIDRWEGDFRTNRFRFRVKWSRPVYQLMEMHLVDAFFYDLGISRDLELAEEVSVSGSAITKLLSRANHYDMFLSIEVA